MCEQEQNLSARNKAFSVSLYGQASKRSRSVGFIEYMVGRIEWPVDLFSTRMAIQEALIVNLLVFFIAEGTEW